jgi:hypothetical protein
MTDELEEAVKRWARQAQPESTERRTYLVFQIVQPDPVERRGSV